jgi:maltooligosyltrehalose trehalohydrolase
MNKDTKILRSFPVGAEVIPGHGIHYRIWAPNKKKVKVVFTDNNIDSIELSSEGNGYFSGLLSSAAERILYKYKLDEDTDLYPDPASLFQPEGPHGPSQAINLNNFSWSDDEWKGINLKGQIIYEMHTGTFTEGGTWLSASEQLDELAELGITTIEIMPIADFPGKFGWGYDGVYIYAPTNLYGSPFDLCKFVDTAHNKGLAVILDVVYNHLGPDGNYLGKFSPFYFNNKYTTDWGDAINFDGENSASVREFFKSNALFWIEKYHFDGLRLDATQDIYDNSAKHILAEIAEAVKNNKLKRSVILIAENEPQNVKLITDIKAGGYGIDGLWNDDFHHSAMVLMTGRREAYYSDYLGNPQEFVSLAKYGYLYQGQYYMWQKKRRGTISREYKSECFINYIQNHDQVANSGRGLYCHKLTSFGVFKAMSALLLMLPQTPLIFQGQEFAASNNFFYFADHNKKLAELVTKGRAEFLSQFRSLALPETQARLPVPSDIKTFYNSKLDFSDRQKHPEIHNLYKDAIKLRKEDEVIASQGEYGVDGAVIGDNAFILRYFSKNNSDRLIVINFGRDIHLNPAPEPLLAPSTGCLWEIIFSTEDLKYGGIGTAPLDTENNWMIPGHSGVVLKEIIQGRINE